MGRTEALCQVLKGDGSCDSRTTRSSTLGKQRVEFSRPSRVLKARQYGLVTAVSHPLGPSTMCLCYSKTPMGYAAEMPATLGVMDGTFS